MCQSIILRSTSTVYVCNIPFTQCTVRSTGTNTTCYRLPNASIERGIKLATHRQLYLYQNHKIRRGLPQI